MRPYIHGRDARATRPTPLLMVSGWAQGQARLALEMPQTFRTPARSQSEAPGRADLRYPLQGLGQQCVQGVQSFGEGFVPLRVSLLGVDPESLNTAIPRRAPEVFGFLSGTTFEAG